MINAERLVNAFMEYVSISSPTRHEREFAEYLMGILTELGFEVQMDDAGEKVGSDSGNVLARLKGSLPDAPPLIFICHMDTVSPGIGIKPVLADGVIRSDGTTILGADDKSGIAAVIEAIRTLKETGIPHGDIELAFSIYEEGGLYGAKNMDCSYFKGEDIFVLDSSGDLGRIVVQSPAQDHLEFTIHGKPSHAGLAPEEGISAIQVAARAIADMNLLRIDADTTANIGRIEGGGATNIVPAEATVIAEARSLDENKLKAQSEHMVQCFERACEQAGAELESKVERMYPAFSLDVNHPIIARTEAAYAACGIATTLTSTGGGSDTNIYSGKGFNAVVLGTGMRKPHTLEEHIYVTDLVHTARFVYALIGIYADARQ